jgi:hypothetical protein
MFDACSQSARTLATFSLSLLRTVIQMVVECIGDVAFITVQVQFGGPINHQFQLEG